MKVRPILIFIAIVSLVFGCEQGAGDRDVSLKEEVKIIRVLEFEGTVVELENVTDDEEAQLQLKEKIFSKGDYPYRVFVIQDVKEDGSAISLNFTHFMFHQKEDETVSVKCVTESLEFEHQFLDKIELFHWLIGTGYSGEAPPLLKLLDSKHR